MTRFTLSILLCCAVISSAHAQQLPSNPDPNKCYVRVVTPDVYEQETDEFLTYSEEEAALYPHQRQKIEIKPEFGQWETTRYDGCESPDPNDCQVLCYRTYPGEYETIYRPKDKTLGKPFYKEITRTIFIEKGGLSSYNKIDCELTSYQSFGSYPFNLDESINSDVEKLIKRKILKVLKDISGARIQFLFRYGGEVPETDAMLLENYLVYHEANPYALVFQYVADDRYVAGDFEIFWRVLNIDQ